jgi:hypothetical protein
MNAAAVSRRASRGAPWANYGAGFKRVLRRVRMHCLQRPQEHLPPSRYGHPDPTWRSFGPERRCSPPAAATTLGPVFDAYSDVGFWLTPGGLAAPQKRSSESDFDSGGPSITMGTASSEAGYALGSRLFPCRGGWPVLYGRSTTAARRSCELKLASTTGYQLSDAIRHETPIHWGARRTTAQEAASALGLTGTCCQRDKARNSGLI